MEANIRHVCAKSTPNTFHDLIWPDGSDHGSMHDPQVQTLLPYFDWHFLPSDPLSDSLFLSGDMSIS